MEVFLKKCINIVIVLFGETAMIYGQAELSRLEVGINLSTYLYQGDLTPSSKGSFRTAGFVFMIFANRAVTPSFSLRTNLAVGSIKGDDGKFSDPYWRQQRNFKFSSPLVELSELLTWNVLKKNGDKGIRRFAPYLFGGIGLSFLNIKRDLSRYNAEYFAQEPHVQAGLNIDLAKSLTRAIPVFPLGIGVKYSLSRAFSVLAESSYRITTTDYLDGFSQAANAARKDQYGSYSLGVVYKFARKNGMDCPAVPK